MTSIPIPPPHAATVLVVKLMQLMIVKGLLTVPEMQTMMQDAINEAGPPPPIDGGTF